MNILILSSGDACRSQIAVGFLQSFAPDHNFFSAGIKPESLVQTETIAVMREAFIDLSFNKPQALDQLLHHNFDMLITLSQEAHFGCSAFRGKVNKYFTFSFDVPSQAVNGAHEEVRQGFRVLRDNIKNEMFKWFKTHLKGV